MAKERTGTAFAPTKLPKAVVTPPLDQQHCSGENQGLANEDEEDKGKAEQVPMPHPDEDMEETGGLTPTPTEEQTAAVSTPIVEKRATTREVQQRGCSPNIAKRLKRTARHKRAARGYISQYTNPEGRRAGLIHIVPPFGAGDDAGKYCIDGFTIDLYAGLLQDRQEKYLSCITPYSPIESCYWTCINAFIYIHPTTVMDHMTPNVPLTRQLHLFFVVVSVMFYNFIFERFCYSGHDCVVYVTALMDVLSLKTVRLHFEHGYVRRMREKCLLSILLYKIAHFPKALLGMSHFIVVKVDSFSQEPHVYSTTFQVSTLRKVRDVAPVTMWKLYGRGRHVSLQYRPLRKD
ncbi:hypothetical protein Cgig2_023565 [Carnegiea gigantea]|uniref:Uncharacterized protein n=1 Tax=Carnegiea gigantea TaxID=171969 RepID=A0A9Q1JZC1_9CARY|nr:hypothetical protein Cgig2_023565 [Carnegiea gigantea]